MLHSEPKYSIGIYGGWGSGKTYLLMRVKKTLQEKHGFDNCVFFNAWKYEEDSAHVTIPLILTILSYIYNKYEVSLNDKPHKNQSQNLKQYLIQVMSGLSMKMTFGVPKVAEIEADYDFLKLFEKKNSFEQTSPLDSSTLYDQIKKLKLERTKVQEGIDLIEGLIDGNYGIVEGANENPELKLAIFVDDLDRCNPTKAFEMFEAIKLLFDIKKGIVFVLALNNEIIERIVELKYKHLNDPELTGRAYLKKIIQLPVNMPSWQSEDIDNYIVSLLENYHDQYFKDIFKQNIVLIKAAVGSNLAEIKRFLNLFIFNYKILQDDGIKPTNLLAIQALAQRWTPFYASIFSNKLFFDSVYKKLHEDKNVKDILSEPITPADEQTLRNLMTILDNDEGLVDFLKGPGNTIFESNLLEQWECYQTIKRVIRVRNIFPY
jgi:KAP-like P-loop domain-containing protein